MTAEMLTDEFLTLRREADSRLVAQGLQPSVFHTSVLESSQITQRDIEELKAHMAELLRIERNRTLLYGAVTKGIFFVLGILIGRL